MNQKEASQGSLAKKKDIKATDERAALRIRSTEASEIPADK